MRTIKRTLVSVRCIISSPLSHIARARRARPPRGIQKTPLMLLRGVKRRQTNRCSSLIQTHRTPCSAYCRLRNCTLGGASCSVTLSDKPTLNRLKNVHRICAHALAGYTAGGALHPALKIAFEPLRILPILYSIQPRHAIHMR